MLKKEIKKSILISLSNKIDDFNVEKTFDLFEKIVFYNTDNKELDGVQFNWESALNTIYDEDSSFSNAKSFGAIIFNIEPILKKILFIIDKASYEALVNNRDGLHPLMEKLGLNPHNRDLNSTNRNHFTEIKISYELRNLTSHQSAEYPRDIFYTNVEAVIITILCAIYLNMRRLYGVNYYAAGLNVSAYMNEVIESFKLKNKKYINLDGSEDIKTINTIVYEDIDSIDDLDEELVGAEPRKGEIDFLRKNSVSEKKMLLVAEAGMGKTTTMEYLAYVDAKEKLDNLGSKIPVILYLNLLIDPKLTIVNYISKKLSITDEETKVLLTHGEINLFLDGLNEIPNITDLRNARLTEINSLVSKYKDTFIIISTRPQTNDLVHKVPKFNLLSMSDSKQIQFVEKNCDKQETRKMVIEAINKNEKIKRVVRTPLFLSIFTKVVAKTGKIPSSEGDLVRIFINSLLEREIKEKGNTSFDIKKGNYLLRGFAYEVKEKYKANSGVIESEIIDCFTKKMKAYSFNVDTLDYLSIFIDLGIIASKDGLYYFFHESYQDYFYSEELRFIIGV